MEKMARNSIVDFIWTIKNVLVFVMVGLDFIRFLN